MNREQIGEVLASHRMLTHERSGSYACANPECGWQLQYKLTLADIKSGVDAVLDSFEDHLAGVLLPLINTESYPEYCPYDCDGCHDEDCPCDRMGCAGSGVGLD